MSLEEREAFDAWRADPLHHAALNQVHEVWGEISGIGEFGVETKRRTDRSRRAVLAAALVLGLAGGLGGGWWKFVNLATQTGIGEQRSQELSDGSIVALNVVTRARYDINGRERRVHLSEGEAAFIVRKDSARPFLVQSGGYEVRAVGTAFNVRNRDHSLDIAVKEGVVEVRRLSGNEKPTILRAGQRLYVKNTGLVSSTPRSISTVPASTVDEWRQRVLTYEDVSVSQVVRDLNRFYDRPLAIDPALGRRHVTLRLVIDDRAGTVKRLAALLGAEIHDAGREDWLKP